MKKSTYSIHDWLVDLESRLGAIEEQFERMGKGDLPVEKHPYRCPICDAKDGDASPHASQVCHSCDGAGIVWG